jgi:hypothetical protein
MQIPRNGHTATLLSTGKVLVAGGNTGTPAVAVASAELYDPATGAWTRTGSLTAGYFNPTAALLPSGKVLQTSGGLAETYDPATGTWTRTGALGTAGRIYQSAALLGTGQFLLLGGKNAVGVVTPAVELYGTGGTWSATGSLREARWLQASVLLKRLP